MSKCYHLFAFAYGSGEWERGQSAGWSDFEEGDVPGCVGCNDAGCEACAVVEYYC